MSNPLSTSIGEGYDFKQQMQGISSGNFIALILGTYNNVYGWHKYEYNGVSSEVRVDGVVVNPEGSYHTLNNCSIIVFTSFSDRDLWVFDSTLKLFDGTTATSSNMVGKLCYFTNDFNISYLD